MKSKAVSNCVKRGVTPHAVLQCFLLPKNTWINKQIMQGDDQESLLTTTKLETVSYFVLENFHTKSDSICNN